MTATIEDFANTVAEYEALAIKSGEWDGIDASEFSDDGVVWSQVWPAGSAPAFARATVYRKGVRAPQVAVIAWAESLPAAEEWRVLWERKPMTLFGSAAKRAAIRHAFRDLVGDRRDEDEFDPAAPAAPAAATVTRDWASELETAASADAIDATWREARAAHARTAQLEVIYLRRRDELRSQAWEPTQVTNTHAIETPREPDESSAPERPAPQDYLPPADGNRAARRARKKGARRGR
ncbi:hypothetical protein [Microbacterium testaceum]|uniref:Uncharacterized protein n=1 Tax=Microbacterium testaceum TaxID=2033 RepID=A0A147F4L2_MICTE|nr:hypothetical protein [Microbacterium testaceum]KTS09061.1 hypothetical protein RSA3_14275 [Microbacterium testaceum]